MPRFFTSLIDGAQAQVVGDDARHIALSLRMKVGEEITLCNNGIDYSCVLEEISPSTQE
jgi:16S rRNA (uracil1498-N3)-methyltransferase